MVWPLKKPVLSLNPLIGGKLPHLVPVSLGTLCTQNTQLHKDQVQLFLKSKVTMFVFVFGKFPPNHQIITKLDRQVLLDDILLCVSKIAGKIFRLCLDIFHWLTSRGRGVKYQPSIPVLTYIKNQFRTLIFRTFIKFLVFNVVGEDFFRDVHN